MKQLMIGILLLLLISCARQVPQTIEVTKNVEVTRLVEATQLVEVTRIVEVTREVTPQTSAGLFLSNMIFPAECLIRNPDYDYWRYEWLMIDSIGGCSYMAPSPDGQYLAYVTLTCSSRDDCGDAVKILQAGSDKPITIQYMSMSEKRWVSSLGWSASGKLAVSYNNINSGAGVYIFGAPFVESLAAGEADVSGGLRQWNAARTAFVTFGAGGGGSCGTRFSGYDFSSGKTFPDIAAILGLDPYEMNILAPDSSYNSANWWHGNSEIYLLITPLEFIEDKGDELFMPTMAGMITLTPDGPEYSTLSSSLDENYYYESWVDTVTIKSRPYEEKYCMD